MHYFPFTLKQICMLTNVQEMSWSPKIDERHDERGKKSKNQATHCQDDTQLHRQISILSILISNNLLKWIQLTAILLIVCLGLIG